MLKRKYKDSIEQKDLAIDKINAGSDEDTKKDARVAVLKTFHSDYQRSGWSKQKIVDAIKHELGGKLKVTQDVASCTFASRATGVILYQIVEGTARFGAANEGSLSSWARPRSI